ncbi:MAG: hypothetical protein GXO20_01530 [Thermodesulfobacteria bacterium]|nr:hypothetical protein [Thermodesulfobacteriota bacterium]
MSDSRGHLAYGSQFFRVRKLLCQPGKDFRFTESNDKLIGFRKENSVQRDPLRRRIVDKRGLKAFQPFVFFQKFFKFFPFIRGDKPGKNVWLGREDIGKENISLTIADDYFFFGDFQEVLETRGGTDPFCRDGKKELVLGVRMFEIHRIVLLGKMLNRKGLYFLFRAKIPFEP